MTAAPRAPRRADDPPWTPVNGLRIGGVIGALAGAAAAAVMGSGWPLVVGAAAGAAIGYATTRRRSAGGG